MLNRETHEVMRLLEEYTNFVDLGQEEKKIDFRYSEIGTDLVYI